MSPPIEPHAEADARAPVDDSVLRAVADLVPAAVIIASADRARAPFVNARAAEIFGATPPASLGEVLATGVEIRDADSLVTDATGAAITLRTTVVPVRGPSGAVIAAVLMASASAPPRGATARPLSRIAHDLRAPIGAISMWTHVLASPNANGEMRARALSSIRASTDAQGRLLDELFGDATDATSRTAASSLASPTTSPPAAAHACERETSGRERH